MNSSAPRKAALRVGRFIANDMQRLGQTSRCGAAPLSPAAPAQAAHDGQACRWASAEAAQAPQTQEGPMCSGRPPSWRMEGAPIFAPLDVILSSNPLSQVTRSLK